MQASTRVLDIFLGHDLSCMLDVVVGESRGYAAISCLNVDHVVSVEIPVPSLSNAAVVLGRDAPVRVW